MAEGCFLAANRASRRNARFWTAAGLLAVGAGGALGDHLSHAQGAGVGRWSSLD